MTAVGELQTDPGHAAPGSSPGKCGVRHLHQLCEFIRGVTFGSAEAQFKSSDEATPILRAGNIQEEIEFENDLIWVPSEHVSANQLLRSGDIVVCMSSGSASVVGKTCQITHSWPGSVGAFCGIIRPRNRQDSDYLAHWLRSPLFLAWRDGQARGANIQNLRFSEMAKVPVPWPSNRNRIAARLREQLGAVAKAHAAVQAQLDAAQILPAAQLRATFASPAARRWPRCKLGDLLRLRKEVVHPHDNPRGPAVFVGLEHVQPLTGRRLGSLALEMSELTGRKPRFYSGDIVYGYLRPYLNKLWVAEFDGLCSVDQYVYEVNHNRAETDFVAWFMRSPVYLERAPIDTTPGQLPRIRTEEVASVEINLPTRPEQKSAVVKMQKQFMETTRLNESLSARLAALEHLPAALLRQAFCGRM